MSSNTFSPDGAIILPADIIGNITIMQEKLQKCLEKRDQLCENWDEGEDLATRIGFPRQEELDEIKTTINETTEELENLRIQGEALKQAAAPVLDKFDKLSSMAPVDFSEFAAKVRMKLAPMLLRMLPVLMQDIPDLLKQHPKLADIVKDDLAFLLDHQPQATQMDQDEVDRLEARLEALEDELKTAASQTKDKDKELRGLRSTVESVTDKWERQKRSEAKVTKRLATAKEEVDKLEDDVEELKQVVADLEQQLDRQKAIAVDYLQQRDEQTRQANLAADMLTRKEQQLAAVEERLDQAIGAWPAAATAHTMFHQQIDKLITDHRAETTRHDRFIDELTRSHETTIEQLQSQISDLNETIAALHVDLSDMTIRNRQKTIAYDERMKDLEAYQESEQGLRASLEKARYSKDTLIKERDQLQRDYTLLEEELRLCQNARDELAKWGDSIEEKLPGSEKRCREIQKEHNTIVGTHRQKHKQTEHNLKIQSAEHEQARKTIFHLRNEKSALKKEKSSALRNFEIQATQLSMAEEGGKTYKLLNEGLKHDLQNAESAKEKLKDELHTAKELLRAAQEDMEAKEAMLSRNEQEHLKAIEKFHAVELQRDEANDTIGRLEGHLRQLELAHSEGHNEVVAKTHATQKFLVRLSSYADTAGMEGLLRAIVADHVPAHAPQPKIAPFWIVQETWIDMPQDSRHSAMHQLHPYSLTMESAMLCLVGAVASHTLSSAYCQLVVCKLTEYANEGPTIPFEVLSELARMVVHSLDAEKETCFETALTFRQLMGLVEQRLQNRLPHNPQWHDSREKLSSYLKDHEYSDIYLIWLGELELETSPCYRSFTGNNAMYTHVEWLQSVMLDTNQKTLRFLTKAQWDIRWDRKLEIRLPRGQAPFVLDTKAGDVEWALGF